MFLNKWNYVRNIFFPFYCIIDNIFRTAAVGIQIEGEYFAMTTESSTDDK